VNGLGQGNGARTKTIGRLAGYHRMFIARKEAKDRTPWSEWTTFRGVRRNYDHVIE
jgi:hypothetical protein